MKWLIIALNAIMLAIAAFNFLVRQNLDIISWLMVNPCSIFVFIMIIGMILNSKILMSISLPGLFYYGTLGLFVFSWNGTAAIAQIGHILMTIGIIYILITVLKKIAIIRFVTGTLIGIVILISLILYQKVYFKEHPGILKALGEPEFIRHILKK